MAESTNVVSLLQEFLNGALLHGPASQIPVAACLHEDVVYPAHTQRLSSYQVPESKPSGDQLRWILRKFFSIRLSDGLDERRAARFAGGGIPNDARLSAGFRPDRVVRREREGSDCLTAGLLRPRYRNGLGSDP